MSLTPLTRRGPATAIAATATAAAVQAAPALAPHVPFVSNRLGIRRELADPREVALTFDDGPHPEATPRVLELLEAHGATATFFLVGEQVRRHPGVAQEIVAAGHRVALHGDSHRCELRLGLIALADDWARGIATIAAATGVVPTLRRPPYGAVSASGLVLARHMGLSTVLWSRWGRAWRARATDRSVAGEVLRGGPAGAIVLLHDADHYGAAGCWRSTVGALPRILQDCSRSGVRTVEL
jgi:peptidoglycan/xylan/chitin deacetylase (PgdA/CDA1 family)